MPGTTNDKRYELRISTANLAGVEEDALPAEISAGGVLTQNGATGYDPAPAGSANSSDHRAMVHGKTKVE